MTGHIDYSAEQLSILDRELMPAWLGEAPFLASLWQKNVHDFANIRQVLHMLY